MTILMYAGATVFTLGMVAMTIAGIRMLLDDGPLAATIVALIGIPLVATLCVMLFMAIGSSNSPILASLKRGEWACTAGHSVTTMVLVGKVMVPSQRFVCDQYGRVMQ